MLCFLPQVGPKNLQGPDTRHPGAGCLPRGACEQERRPWAPGWGGRGLLLPALSACLDSLLSQRFLQAGSSFLQPLTPARLLCGPDLPPSTSQPLLKVEFVLTLVCHIESRECSQEYYFT